jgi:hypothetical protein
MQNTQEYLIVLLDLEGNVDWQHPSTLRGRTREEVRSKVLENTDAAYIEGIYTANEYTAKFYPQHVRQVPGNKNQEMPNQMSGQSNAELTQALLMSEHPQGGNAFMDHMVNAVINNCNTQNMNQPESIPDKTTPVATPTDPAPNPTLQTAYFTDNGIEFKIENNILYKKIWQTIPDEELNQFRIVTKETEKVFKSEKYTIQRLDWSPVTTK